MKEGIFRRMLRMPIMAGLFVVAGFLGHAHAAAASTLYLSPSTGSFAVGASFSTTVFVNSGGTAMNAAEGKISFPADKLQVTSLGKSGSIFNLWVQEPVYNNSAGTISFEGVVYNPGYTGSAGKIIAITFKVKSAGDAKVAFTSGAVLANDGLGTNTLTGFGNANYTLGGGTPAPNPTPAPAPAPAPAPVPSTSIPTAPVVTSSTHPDPNSWYSNNNPSFSWKLPSGVNGVSIFSDQSSTNDPGRNSDGIFSHYEYSNVEDGVWYLHLRFKNANGWGPATHFRYRIDTVKPDSFEATELTEKNAPGEVVIRVSAHDALSGIGWYTFALRGGSATRWVDDGSHEYHATGLPEGKQEMVVRAFDLAGNYLEKSLNVAVTPMSPVMNVPAEAMVGEQFTVTGMVAPGASVTMQFGPSGGPFESQTAVADENGKVSFLVTPRGEGLYEFRFTITTKDGLTSPMSEPSFVVVKLKDSANFETFLTDFSLPIAIILLLIIFFCIMGWHLYRDRRDQKRQLAAARSKKKTKKQ